MKIEIGRYIRTYDGRIGKICECPESAKQYYNDYIWLENKSGFEIIEEDNVFKIGSELIDMVEPGDYVNGIWIDENKDTYLSTLDIDYEDSSIGHISYIKIYPNEIKTIMTGEVFESECYKVEDK